MTRTRYVDERHDWTFKDADLVERFDQYVRDQLPFYDLATDAVADIVRAHLPPGGIVVDVGASTGNIGRALAATLNERNADLIAIEPSAEMRAQYQGPGTVVDSTAIEYHMPPADVIVSFLTLGFVAPHERRNVITSWQSSLRTGGTIIAVERIALTEQALLCRHLIHAAKVRSNNTETHIALKEVALSGVLRPLHPDLFPSFGGALFFAYGDFHGYLIGGDQHERR